MDPINYNVPGIDANDILSAYRGGLETGQAEKAITAQREQQQVAQERQQMIQADLGKLLGSSTPSARGYGEMMVKYPEIADNLKKGWDVLSDNAKQSKISNSATIYSALIAGRYDIAQDNLKELAQGHRDAGEPEKAKQYDTAVELVKSSPSTAKHTMAMMLAAIMGADKFSQTFGDIQQEERDARAEPYLLAQQGANAQKAAYDAASAPVMDAMSIENTQSQISERGKRISLDREALAVNTSEKVAKLQAQAGKLSPAAEKIVNDSVTSSVNSEAMSSRMEGLADRIITASAAGDYSEGILGKGEETLASIFGGQDEVSNIRAEYRELVNKQVMDNLPPGVASDRDIALAREGFMKDTADVEALSRQLRGMAKLARWKAVREDVKAQWAAESGHLGKSRKDISVAGNIVPAGMTLQEFIRQSGDDIYNAVSTSDKAARVSKRSYMNY